MVNTINLPLSIKNTLELRTPCHIMDLDRLEENLEKIRLLKEKSGCRVLLAVKGFSAPFFFKYMYPYIDGVSASGLYEAKMGRECFGGYVQTYSPGFQTRTIDEVAENSDAVIFNSVTQLESFRFAVEAKRCSYGIRINPMRSGVKKVDADPCGEYSRLGIPYLDITPELLRQVEGIHIHAMCEQFPDALEDIVSFLIDKMGDSIDQAGSIRWINLGGGQLIGSREYDIDRASASIQRVKDRFHVDVILEPCEGIVTEAGYFATSVCDIVTNRKNTAILDASPICHLQDAVFRGWRHDVCGEISETQKGFSYFLSGPTCFAGDTFGEYTFKEPLHPGDIIFFKDTAAYSWVKNNTFNGIPYPEIYAFTQESGLQHVKTYSYEAYLNSL